MGRSIQEDVLIWPFNLDEEYSAKPSYKFLQKEQQSPQPKLQTFVGGNLEFESSYKSEKPDLSCLPKFFAYKNQPS